MSRLRILLCDGTVTDSFLYSDDSDEEHPTIAGMIESEDDLVTIKDPALRVKFSNLADPAQLSLRAGVVEEEDLDVLSASQDLEASSRNAPPLDPQILARLTEVGLTPEDFDADYGLLVPEDVVIVRPYGGEDDDILLQELRPRFVVMYEPNLPFIRRLEVCPVSAALSMD